ncbi:MAG: ISKra4 family transposase [Candidatus Magasanikbacteria bacterium]|nr:ISKra4 family transposase [Candidatus Magasanikbacteria bacterium]
MGKKKEYQKVKEIIDENPQAKTQVKKSLHWHTTFGDVSINEQTFIINGKLVRPFCESAHIACRGYSLLLERRITDFGSDFSFGKSAKKIKEHYGLDIPESSIRIITQKHGNHLLGAENQSSNDDNTPGVEQIIVQTDGCMIPKIEFIPNGEESDLRKTRKVGWKEVRLSLGYIPGMNKPIYEATSGTTEETGRQLLSCASQVGYGKNSKIHGVGDGAKWIADQIETQFGSNGTYLIDFYHLCEYLHAAAKSCSEAPEDWYKKVKQLMYDGKHKKVLEKLEPSIEPSNIEDEQAPVRKCYRYIKNRPKQFNYPQAIKKGLPIGSGKIESGNKSVLQSRMKITGAWWKVENIDKMLVLLTCKQNEKWDNYWGQIPKAA